MVDAFDKEIDVTSDHAQAAHLAYRLGILHFSEGNRDSAIAAFGKAIDHLGMLKHAHRYFLRTLVEFYGLWQKLATDATDALLRHPLRRDHLSLLRSSAFDEHRPAFQLLLVMELIIEQLDVLAGSPVNDPIGLTSLEICLLLERVGYPREWYGPTVYNRLRRIKSDMEANKIDHTVDEGCCLCTGVAASCLILNQQDDDAARLLKWLRAQKRDDYCGRRVDRFTRAPRKNHGLNYAAMVLQAFVDHSRAEEESHIRNILNLFKSGNAKTGQFPDRWTKNVTSPMYDFSTYAFHALARYSLAGGFFDTSEKDVIKNALHTLAQWLRQDAIAAGLEKEEMGRPYAARENVGSLALGLLIDENPVVDEAIVGYNLRRLATYAADPDVPLTVRARTMDSNLDRIRKMLEGWLLQMEATLYRRERGWNIPGFLTEWLGISAKQP
jgi:tetratricopeptide (TPR) repeat protein